MEGLLKCNEVDIEEKVKLFRRMLLGTSSSDKTGRAQIPEKCREKSGKKESKKHKRDKLDPSDIDMASMARIMELSANEPLEKILSASFDKKGRDKSFKSSATPSIQAADVSSHTNGSHTKNGTMDQMPPNGLPEDLRNGSAKKRGRDPKGDKCVTNRKADDTTSNLSDDQSESDSDTCSSSESCSQSLFLAGKKKSSKKKLLEKELKSLLLGDRKRKKRAINEKKRRSKRRHLKELLKKLQKAAAAADSSSEEDDDETTSSDTDEGTDSGSGDSDLEAEPQLDLVTRSKKSKRKRSSLGNNVSSQNGTLFGKRRSTAVIVKNKKKKGENYLAQYLLNQSLLEDGRSRKKNRRSSKGGSIEGDLVLKLMASQGLFDYTESLKILKSKEMAQGDRESLRVEEKLTVPEENLNEELAETLEVYEDTDLVELIPKMSPLPHPKSHMVDDIPTMEMSLEAVPTPLPVPELVEETMGETKLSKDRINKKSKSPKVTHAPIPTLKEQVEVLKYDEPIQKVDFVKEVDMFNDKPSLDEELPPPEVISSPLVLSNYEVELEGRSFGSAGIGMEGMIVEDNAEENGIKNLPKDGEGETGVVVGKAITSIKPFQPRQYRVRATNFELDEITSSKPSKKTLLVPPEHPTPTKTASRDSHKKEHAPSRSSHRSRSGNAPKHHHKQRKRDRDDSERVVGKEVDQEIMGGVIEKSRHRHVGKKEKKKKKIRDDDVPRSRKSNMPPPEVDNSKTIPPPSPTVVESFKKMEELDSLEQMIKVQRRLTDKEKSQLLRSSKPEPDFLRDDDEWAAMKSGQPKKTLPRLPKDSMKEQIMKHLRTPSGTGLAATATKSSDKRRRRRDRHSGDSSPDSQSGQDGVGTPNDNYLRARLLELRREHERLKRFEEITAKREREIEAREREQALELRRARQLEQKRELSESARRRRRRHRSKSPSSSSSSSTSSSRSSTARRVRNDTRDRSDFRERGDVSGDASPRRHTRSSRSSSTCRLSDDNVIPIENGGNHVAKERSVRADSTKAKKVLNRSATSRNGILDDKYYDEGEVDVSNNFSDRAENSAPRVTKGYGTDKIGLGTESKKVQNPDRIKIDGSATSLPDPSSGKGGSRIPLDLEASEMVHSDDDRASTRKDTLKTDALSFNFKPLALAKPSGPLNENAKNDKVFQFNESSEEEDEREEDTSNQNVKISDSLKREATRKGVKSVVGALDKIILSDSKHDIDERMIDVLAVSIINHDDRTIVSKERPSSGSPLRNVDGEAKKQPSYSHDSHSKSDDSDCCLVDEVLEGHKEVGKDVHQSNHAPPSFTIESSRSKSRSPFGDNIKTRMPPPKHSLTPSKSRSKSRSSTRSRSSVVSRRNRSSSHSSCGSSCSHSHSSRSTYTGSSRSRSYSRGSGYSSRSSYSRSHSRKNRYRSSSGRSSSSRSSRSSSRSYRSYSSKSGSSRSSSRSSKSGSSRSPGYTTLGRRITRARSRSS